MTRWMRIGVRVALLTLLLGALAPAAQAASTPQQCDADVKYWCTMVSYDGRTVYDRYYRGGIDGGAEKWRLNYIKDWYWNGSQWVLDATFGPSPWYTNIALSNWMSYSSDNYLANTAAIQFRLQYWECNPDGCYDWWSTMEEHWF